MISPSCTGKHAVAVGCGRCGAVGAKESNPERGRSVVFRFRFLGDEEARAFLGRLVTWTVS